MATLREALRIHSFHFDDVTVTIHASDPRFESALQRLAMDFANFATGEASGGTKISIEISEGVGGSISGFWSTRLTPRYRFFPRVCDHGAGTTSRISRRGALVSVAVVGVDADHVYEIAYVAILSLLGWELEKKGYIRLHALTVGFGPSATVFHLPPKGGKSTLALEAIGRGFDVLGDEVSLIRDGVCYAFPIRIAVAPAVASEMTRDSRLFHRKTFDDKALVQLPSPRARALPLGSVVFQSRPGLATEIERADLFSSFAWIVWVCAGLGLPQMREFVLRIEELVWIPKLAWQRLAFAYRLLMKGSLKVSRSFEPIRIGAEIRTRIEWARSSSETSESATS